MTSLSLRVRSSLGWSGSGSVVQDHSDHGASKEPMNPLWSRIHRLLWCNMIRVILVQITPKERTQRLVPITLWIVRNLGLKSIFEVKSYWFVFFRKVGGRVLRIESKQVGLLTMLILKFSFLEICISIRISCENLISNLIEAIRWWA